MRRLVGGDAADNRFGEAGAVVIAKALESGECKLTSLGLYGESRCLRAWCLVLGVWCCALPASRGVVCAGCVVCACARLEWRGGSGLRAVWLCRHH